MAVPEFLRKARTMKVYTKARSILNHTRQIIYSEKNIPKRVRNPYAAKLEDEASEMFACVGRANCIHPTTGQGYLLTDSGKIVRRMDKRSITRERRRLKKMAEKVGRGELPERKLDESYQSWRSYARMGNTKSLIYQMDKLYNSLRQQARKEVREHEHGYWAGVGERTDTAARDAARH